MPLLGNAGSMVHVDPHRFTIQKEHDSKLVKPVNSRDQSTAGSNNLFAVDASSCSTENQRPVHIRNTQAFNEMASRSSMALEAVAR